MIRNILIVALLLGLVLGGIYWLLQNGNLMAFAPRLPGQETAPMLEYYAGQIYFTGSDYDDAETYFKYVYDHFPLSSYAEPAHAYWLESLGQQFYKSAAQTVIECKAFLQQYPKSAYAPRVRKIQEKAETGTLH